MWGTLKIFRESKVIFIPSTAAGGRVSNNVPKVTQQGSQSRSGKSQHRPKPVASFCGVTLHNRSRAEQLVWLWPGNRHNRTQATPVFGQSWDYWSHAHGQEEMPPGSSAFVLPTRLYPTLKSSSTWISPSSGVRESNLKQFKVKKQSLKYSWFCKCSSTFAHSILPKGLSAGPALELCAQSTQVSVISLLATSMLLILLHSSPFFLPWA